MIAPKALIAKCPLPFRFAFVVVLGLYFFVRKRGPRALATDAAQ